MGIMSKMQHIYIERNLNVFLYLRLSYFRSSSKYTQSRLNKTCIIKAILREENDGCIMMPSSDKKSYLETVKFVIFQSFCSEVSKIKHIASVFFFSRLHRIPSAS